MATIVTRAGKGAPLTHNEVDANFTNLNTDKLETSGGTLTGNLSFGDNDKAIFGAGSDLQIYHDGVASYIVEGGAGELILQSDGANISLWDGGGYMLRANNGGSLQLYHNRIEKLATTATGIDVTGTVVSDKLQVTNATGGLAASNYAVIEGSTVDNTNYPGILLKGGTLATTYPALKLGNGGLGLNILNGYSATYPQRAEVGASNSGVAIRTSTTGTALNRFLAASNGDISFYEDTGTTPKFFWDASAETLQIGDNSDGYSLNTGGISSIGTGFNGVNSPVLRLHNTTPTTGRTYGINSDDSGLFQIYDADAGSATRFSINSSGNVGIGTSSPQGNVNAAARVLQISGDNTNTPEIKAGGSNAEISISGGASASYLWSKGAYPLVIATSSVERMRITSAGEVGINVASPTAELHVRSVTGSSILRIENGSQTLSGRVQVDAGDGTFNVFNEKGYALTFGTGNTERARIDASGDLLVGKTAQSNTVEGLTINQNGLIISVVTNAGGANQNLFLNRQDADGNFIVFRKSNATVGTIGTTSGRVYMADDFYGGISFSSGAKTLFSTNSAGSVEDNAMDIGSGSYRWKDLYLSGSLKSNIVKFASLTGTEFMRITSDGNVAINNTAGQSLLDIRGVNKSVSTTTSTENAMLHLQSQEGGALGSGADILFTGEYLSTNTYAAGSIGTVREVGPTSGTSYNNTALVFRTSDYPDINEERVRISGFGYVGIGETDPQQLLHIKTAASNSARVRLENSEGAVDVGTDGGNMFFVAGGSERMRVTSGGNFLVGQTSLNYNTIGGSLSAGGTLRVCADSYPAALFNRKTTNGDIAIFYKDGSTIGSIGSEGGDSLYIGNGDAGLKFSGLADVIQPFNPSTVAARDAAIDIGSSGARFKDLYLSARVVGTSTISVEVPENAGAAIQMKFGDVSNTTRRTVQFYKDKIQPSSADDGDIILGASSNRFKDLYLSGGVYLGGTGSANYLDDYEEGTWTPTLHSGGTVTGVAGFYNKVGRQVTAWCYFSIATISGSGTLYVGGLPFTEANTFGSQGPVRNQGVNNATYGNVFTAEVQSSTALIRFHYPSSSSSQLIVQVADASVSDFLAFTVTYNTNA